MQPDLILILTQLPCNRVIAEVQFYLAKGGFFASHAHVLKCDVEERMATHQPGREEQTGERPKRNKKSGIVLSR
jgi:hypothetical protein